MEMLKTFYGAVGAPYPTISTIIVSVIFAVIGAFIWFNIGLQYQKDVNQNIVESVNNTTPIVKSKSAEITDNKQSEQMKPNTSEEGMKGTVAISGSYNKNTVIKNVKIQGFDIGLKESNSSGTLIKDSSINVNQAGVISEGSTDLKVEDTNITKIK